MKPRHPGPEDVELNADQQGRRHRQNQTQHQAGYRE
jgi:hypothetical protein